MENENEQDVDIDENFVDTSTDDTTEEEDTTDYKAKYLEEQGRRQRAETKLEKVKGQKAEKQEQKPIVSNEPDYAKLAFLKGEGITHPEDQKIVQDEANRLKLPLTDILSMGHMKAQLEANKDQREALAGMPKSNGSRSNQTQNDVDYWLAKGETPADVDLAEKVINARIHKEKNANQFSDDLYTG